MLGRLTTGTSSGFTEQEVRDRCWFCCTVEDTPHYPGPSSLWVLLLFKFVWLLPGCQCLVCVFALQTAIASRVTCRVLAMDLRGHGGFYWWSAFTFSIAPSAFLFQMTKYSICVKVTPWSARQMISQPKLCQGNASNGIIIHSLSSLEFTTRSKGLFAGLFSHTHVSPSAN